MGFGPVQGSGSVAAGSIGTTQLADGAVTLAKMADLATDRLIGRVTGGTGVPEAVTFGDGGQAVADDASAAAVATTLGLGTGDSPQFAGVNLGHATDTTLTREQAGMVNVEGKPLAMVLDRDAVAATVANDINTTTVYTFSVPANTLGSARRLRLTATGIISSAAVPGTAVLTLNYGATALIIATGAVVGNSLATAPFLVECFLSGLNATNAQDAHGVWRGLLGTGGAVRHFTNRSSMAEDSTGALTLTLTWKWDTADAGNTITFEHFTLELV